MKCYKIYILKNNINEKKYIGYTRLEVQDRLNAHKDKSIDYHNKKLKGLEVNKHVLSEAIIKYGIENFSIKEIEGNLTHHEAKIREMFWIHYYQTFFSFNLGYNMTLGGDGGGACSELTRLKIGRANKNKLVGIPLTETHKKKISIGKLNSSWIPVISEEQKRKISEANKLSWQNLERRQKGSGVNASMYGKRGYLCHFSNSTDYYETTPTRIDSFKDHCKNVGINEDNFERIETGQYQGDSGKKLYLFKFISNEYSWSELKYKEKLHRYVTKQNTTSGFKTYCSTNNLNEDNFERINKICKNKITTYNFIFKGDSYSWANIINKPISFDELIYLCESKPRTEHYFGIFCLKNNLNKNHFEKIYHSKKRDESQYIFIYKGEQYNREDVEFLEWLSKYEKLSVRRCGFKIYINKYNKNKNKNISFDDFIETFDEHYVLPINSSTKKYFYNYKNIK